MIFYDAHLTDDNHDKCLARCVNTLQKLQFQLAVLSVLFCCWLLIFSLGFCASAKQSNFLFPWTTTLVTAATTLSSAAARRAVQQGDQNLKTLAGQTFRENTMSEI